MTPPPSIPPSPQPGKDPPSAEPPQTEPFPSTTSSPPSEQSRDVSKPAPTDSEEEKDIDKDKDKDKQSMPPPPLPSPLRTLPTLMTSTTNESRLLYMTAQGDPSASQEGNDSQQHLQMPVQPSNFVPFFVLVDDKASKGTSTSHPRRVHYLFSDDDVSEVLTQSLLTSMSTQSRSAKASPSNSREMERSNTSRSSSSSTTFKNTKLSTRKEKERDERVIIVDINETGTEVTGVNSVSGKWQVLQAGIEKAPTFEGDDSSEAENGGGGMMLRIEGVGVESLVEEEDASGGREKEKERESGGLGMGEDEMRELLEGFDRKMGILRKVVGERVDGA
ncbi:hypothetical protein BGZ60DRAFT_527937 [Tricladium varicosporioides]|nr:hypothetical protein BGZ60DRAFT_527937 [Hymenoscyphus varicosporioides]